MATGHFRTRERVGPAPGGRRAASAEEIDVAYREAAEKPPEDVLRVPDVTVVSRDVVGGPASCIPDAPLIQTYNHPAKAFGWYDNAWGCTDRLPDFTSYVAAPLPGN